MKLSSTLFQFLVIALILVSNLATSAQARLILNNGGTINISGGAYLVIDNPAANAITRITSGHIISEGENNVLKWNIGTTAASYTIPWGDASGSYIPVTFTTASATGSGYFHFSTYPTVPQNSTQLPSGVTNINGASGTDNSLFASDRFWQVNAQNYTMKPILSNLVFTYLDAENATPNTIIEDDLRANRYNNTLNSWTDQVLSSTVNTTNNTVTVTSVDAANLYIWWAVGVLGANRYWVASSNSTSNVSANWSETSGGAGNAGVPTYQDAVFFDGGSSFDCAVDANLTAANLLVDAGYGGTITQGASTITLNNTATFSGGIFAGGTADIFVPGAFTISGTAFTSTAANLDLKNDLSIVGGSFGHNNGIVTFSGSGTQTISGTNTYYGLTINKSSGNVVLSGTATTSVIGSLTLTSGNIVSSSTNPLDLGPATVSGGSASSYLSGPISKTIAASASFTAPLGSVSASLYRPVTIANTSASDSWSFEYIGSNPTTDGYPNTTMNTANIAAVSEFEYWLISRSGATTADLTLSYGPGSYIPPDIGVITDLRVARWDASYIPAPGRWDLPPVNGGSTNGIEVGSDNISGTVKVTNVNNFSPVSLSSLDANSALPIELISFTGRLVEAGVELNWKTTSEMENDYFAVEKSIDGEKFTQIGKVAGHGTTSTFHNYQFIDEKVIAKAYYRLKQTDFNGRFTLSNVLRIDFIKNDGFIFSIYPNPANDTKVTIEITGARGIKQVPIGLYDQVGKQKFSRVLVIDEMSGSGKETFSVENLASGVYFIRFGTSNTVQRIMINR